MSRLWFLTALVPIVYFVGGLRQRGFRAQPGIVQAGRADRFAQRVAAAGGPAVVRRGLLIDAGFIALDTVEDVLLLRALGGGARAVPVLPGVYWLKTAAYLGSVGLAVDRLVHG
jgi:hypothetical protein